MMLSRALTSFAVAAALILPSVDSAATESGLQVGDPFPELVLPSLANGEPMSITAFRGRKLVLHVWASW